MDLQDCRGQLGWDHFNSKTQAFSSFTFNCKDFLLELLLDAAKCCKVVHLEHMVLQG